MFLHHFVVAHSLITLRTICFGYHCVYVRMIYLKPRTRARINYANIARIKEEEEEEKFYAKYLIYCK